jgi:hypothetical protein
LPLSEGGVMATTKETMQELERKRAELKARLAEVGDMRPGSLVERYRRCGKAGCHCAGEGAEGHGPSWSLTREVGGKTVTRVLPARCVPEVREQIGEYRRFRGLARELVEASEQLCDARLAAAREAATPADGEKGGSRRSLRRRS